MKLLVYYLVLLTLLNEKAFSHETGEPHLHDGGKSIYKCILNEMTLISNNITFYIVKRKYGMK